jgi:DNA polymerase III subunit beta
MKITINQKNLKQATLITEKIVSRNASLPILNNILIKTENGRVRLSATNLEIGIHVFIGAKINEVGEIAVPARIFSDFVSAITSEKINLTTKNNTLSIISDEHKTQILGFDPKDFPIIPKLKTDPLAVINATELKNYLISVIDSMAISETRPELAGVFVGVKNNNSTLASTDGFRLSEVIFPIKNKETFSVILPRNTVTELIRVCGDVEGDITVRLSDNQLSFSNDDIELVSRVVDGTYPDYQKVIPEKFITKALVKKDDLEKSIRLAGLFSSITSEIKIACAGEIMTISAKNSDKGETETTVPAILKNDPFEISLNYRYVLDALKNIPTTDVVVEFTGINSPFVIRPSNDKKVTYLVMPLRT